MSTYPFLRSPLLIVAMALSLVGCAPEGPVADADLDPHERAGADGRFDVDDVDPYGLDDAKNRTDGRRFQRLQPGTDYVKRAMGGQEGEPFWSGDLGGGAILTPGEDDGAAADPGADEDDDVPGPPEFSDSDTGLEDTGF